MVVAVETMKKILCLSSFNRSAIVILIWVGLLCAFLPFFTQAVHSKSDGIENIANLGFLFSFYVFLPFLGLLADIKISQFNFAMISAALVSLIPSVFSMVRNLLDVGSFEFYKYCNACKHIANGLYYIDDPLNLMATKAFWLLIS